MSDTFSDLFFGLNPQQLKAVRENEKPLLIIAGAGSGKTKVITTKVINLIRSGVKPSSILALTFTKKAAEEMLNRVMDKVGEEYDLQISTFHSFCNQFLKDNILETKLNSEFKVISDTAQLVFFAKNMNTFGLEHIEFGGTPVTLAEEAQKFISKCKEEFISADELQQYIEDQVKQEKFDEEDVNNLKDMLKMFRAYEAYTQENNMVDYGDMLSMVHEILLKDKRILQQYQQKYQYVLVDEFQDTNYLQLHIVHMIASIHKRICVVGDDDQSIYAFRGAYATNIAEFKRLFPEYVQVTLEQNYRSTKKILEVANKLISNQPRRSAKRLVANGGEGDPVSVVECDTDAVQTVFVADKVEQLASKRSLDDIAILCRSRAGATPVANELRKRQIPTQFLGFSDFFSEAITKDVVATLKVINNPAYANAELVRVLERDPFNLRRTEVARLGNLASRKICSIYEAIKYIDEIEIDKEKFLAVKKKLDDLIAQKNKLTTGELVHKILFSKDFYGYEVELDNKRNVTLLNQFYVFTEDYASLYPQSHLSEFISFLQYASGFEMTEKIDSDNAVKIMTIHTAKGKEFPVVIILNAVERRFPSQYRKDKFPLPDSLLKGVKPLFTAEERHMQEERRLMYVAMTRAKENLIITYPKKFNENTYDSRPSRFLTEIKYKENPSITFEKVEADKVKAPLNEEDRQITVTRKVVSDLNTENYAAAIEKILLLAKMRNKDIRSLLWQVKEPDLEKDAKSLKNIPDHTEVINENFIYSSSQFSTYNICPRTYQYHYVYRIPTAAKSYFDLGANVHSVIEEVTKKIKAGEEVTQEQMIKILDKEWNPKGFESKLHERRSYEEAKQMLTTFLEEQKQTRSEIVDIEKEFTVKIDNIQVRGRIDRIDKQGDDFVVIDYKTSKESLSAMDLRQDPQLITYTLVVENLYGKRPKSVGWWFLRSNRKVMSEVKDEDLQKVKQQMLSIVASIKKGDFHPTPGWVCQRCDYTTICDASTATRVG